MNDEFGGAASGAPATDQAGRASAGATSSAQQGAEGAGEETLTLSQVKALIEERDQRLLDEATRRSQTLVDKADSRITQRYRAEMAELKRLEEAYKATGQELPAEVRRVLGEQAIQRAVDGGAEAGHQAQQHPQGQGGAGEGAQGQGAADATMAAAIQLQDASGVYILDGDPEVELIAKTTDRAVFLASVQGAIDAKIERKAAEVAARRKSGTDASGDDGAGDGAGEGAEDKSKPGQGLQRRGTGSGKRSSKLIDGQTPGDFLDAGFKEAMAGLTK